MSLLIEGAHDEIVFLPWDSGGCDYLAVSHRLWLELTLEAIDLYIAIQAHCDELKDVFIISEGQHLSNIVLMRTLDMSQDFYLALWGQSDD